ncbi:MAG: hypothetical protein ACTMIK_12845 [Galactobacter sp.]
MLFSVFARVEQVALIGNFLVVTTVRVLMRIGVVVLPVYTVMPETGDEGAASALATPGTSRLDPKATASAVARLSVARRGRRRGAVGVLRSLFDDRRAREGIGISGQKNEKGDVCHNADTRHRPKGTVMP